MQRLTVVAAALGLSAGASLLSLPAECQTTGHIVTINVDPWGYLPPGPNAMAPGRSAVIQSFYKSHSDSYDFVVAFPAFPTNFGAEALGLHHGIRNDVNGIGKLPFDNSSIFGSSPRLKAFIDVGSLIPGSIVPTAEDATAVVAHEVAHQWSGQVHFQSEAWNPPSGDMLGRDGAHWSFFLDSDASVLYGSTWASSGNGSFRAIESRKRYSPLDLYLMGFLSADEVAPATLIQPAVSTTFLPTALPPPDGTQIQGGARSIDISDIIAAEGARAPAASQSQHEFRAAFLLLIPNGKSASSDQLAFVDQVRRAWANEFFFLTRGRGVMETDLVDAPPSAVASNASVKAGLNYLLNSQKADGSWFDLPGTAIRETEESLEALALFSDVRIPDAVQRATAFLQTATVEGTDAAARRVLGLLAGNVPISDASPLLASLANRKRNADGGLGHSPGFSSSLIDSLLAASALTRGGSTPPSVSDLTRFILEQRNPDFGWPMTLGGPSRIEASARVIELLAQLPSSSAIAGAMADASVYLQKQRKTNGDYFDDLSTPAATSRAVLGLTAARRLASDAASGTASRLLSTQAPDGSWDASAYRTAVSLKALRTLLTPNLSITASDIEVASPSASEGDTVVAFATVHNTGIADAANVVVQAFDSNGQAFGEQKLLGTIAPGASAKASLLLNTAGREGSTQLFVVADPQGVVDELRKDDNRAAAAFEVRPPPDMPDLFVAPGSVQATPGSIDRLPAMVVVTATIGNLGTRDVLAANVYVQVGGMSFSTTLALAGRSSTLISVPVTVTSAVSDLPVTVTLDARLVDVNPGNNTSSGVLRVIPTIRLALEGLTVSPRVSQGQDVRVDFLVRNLGTVDATGTAATTITDSAGTLVSAIPTTRLSIAAGSAAQVHADWRARTPGTYTASASLAFAGNDASDNSASAPVIVDAVSQPNLVLGSGALSIAPDPPMEGSPTTISAAVTNVGAVAAGPFALTIYLGNPSSGGVLLSRAQISGLAPGETRQATAPYTPQKREPFALFAIADPDNEVQEYDEQDNIGALQVDPVSWPDLVVTDGDVRPSSLFPRPGEPVSVSVSLFNGGDRSADGATLTLYLGRPEEGGRVVGGTSLSSIAAHAFAFAEFTLDTTGLSGPVRLVAIANEGRTVTEEDYTNNRGEREIDVQSTSLALTNPYFSPNGDGVKDTTTLFVRRAYLGQAAVQIVNKAGESKRTLSVDLTSGQASVTWDGLDDRDQLVDDGEYEMRVLGIEGGVEGNLGAIAVVVDTNRTPLEDPVAPTIAIPIANGERILDATPIPGQQAVYYVLEERHHFRGQALFRQDLLGAPERLHSLEIGDSGSWWPFGLEYEEYGYGYRVASNWSWETGQTRRRLGNLEVSKDGHLIASEWASRDSYWSWGVSVYDTLAGLRFEAGSEIGGPRYVLDDYPHLGGHMEFDPTDDTLYYERAGYLVAVSNLLGTAPTSAASALGGLMPGVRDPNAWPRPTFSADASPLSGDAFRADNAFRISPDRKRVAYANEVGLFVAGMAGSAPTRLLAGSTLPSPGSNSSHSQSRLGQFEWLPSGNAIVFFFDGYSEDDGLQQCAMEQDPAQCPSLLGRGLREISPETGIVSRAVAGESGEWPASPALFALSPSGKSVAFWRQATSSSTDRAALFVGSLAANDPGRKLAEINLGGCFDDLDSLDFDSDIHDTEGYRYSYHYSHKNSCRAGNPLASPGDLEWSRDGTMLIYKGRDAYQAEAGAIWSLANLVGVLEATRPAGSNGLQISGTAADLHLESWEIAVRPRGTTAAASPIARSTVAVSRGLLAQWIPPAPGVYEVVLTARDLAGNVRATSATVSWTERAPIANLLCDPEYISPNGDGLQDSAHVRYETTVPVTTEITLANEAGTAIRHLTRTHVDPGVYSLDWDGRDDGGAVVPDGRFELRVDGTEVSHVIVDDTLPEVSVAELAAGCMDVPGELKPFGGGFDVNVADVNFVDWTLEERVAGSGDGYQAFGKKADPRWKIAAPLEFFRGKSFRWRARDLAGNVTVSDERSYPELLELKAIGKGHLDAGHAPDDSLESTCRGLQGRSERFQFAPQIYDFRMSTSIGEPIVSYSILYAAGRQETRVDQVNVLMIDETRVLWDARAVPEGDFELTIRATDARGRVFDKRVEFYSNPLRLEVCIGAAPETLLVQVHSPDALDPDSWLMPGATVELQPLDSSAAATSIGFSPSGAPGPVFPLVAASVLYPDAGSAGDWVENGMAIRPGYQARLETTALPGCRHSVRLRGSLARGDEVDLRKEVNLCAIQLASADVTGFGVRLQAAETLRSRFDSAVIRIADQEVGTLAGFEGTSVVTLPRPKCGLHFVQFLPVVDGRLVDTSACAKCGIPVEIPCTWVSVEPPVLRNAPASCEAYAPEYDIVLHAESENSQVVDLVAEAEAAGTLQTLPLAVQGFAPGSKVSARVIFQTAGLREGLYRIRARATNAQGVVASGELSDLIRVARVPPLVSLSAPAQGDEVCIAPSSTHSLAVSGSVAAQVLKEYRVVLRGPDGSAIIAAEVQQSRPAPFTKSGELASVDLTDLGPGDYEIVVEASDALYGSACSPPVAIHLVEGGEISSLSVDPGVFSPDGDGLSETASLAYTLDRASQVSISANGPGGAAFEQSIGRELAGQHTFFWDGLGATADGVYELRVAAASVCGTSSRGASVIVDRLPPVARIDAPLAGALVSGLVAVRGEASDANFASFDLLVGSNLGGAWRSVYQAATPSNGVVGVVDFGSASAGEYTLRLVARDAVGHLSQSDVPVRVAQTDVIGSLALMPMLISPNADGVLDTSLATMVLKQPASMSLDLLSAGGSVAVVLIPPTSKDAGTSVFSLDGTVLGPIADGDYTVRLSAANEMATAPLLIDRTKPDVALRTPIAGGQVAGVTDIALAISDRHLVSWSVSHRAPGGGSDLIAQGTSSVDGSVARLSGLADGIHRILVTAADAAGNTSDATYEFGSDSSKPSFEITAPLPGAYLSGREHPIDIRYSVSDSNLARVAIDVVIANGLSRTLCSMDSPSAGPLLCSWDARADAEGQARVIARAWDLAGNGVEKEVSVILDNTPPVAWIDHPRGGAMKPGESFIGTATDANFEHYSLEIAGPTGGFVSIGTGTQPLSAGPIVAPQQIPDGSYTARLTVVDRAGNRATNEVAFLAQSTLPQPPSDLRAQRVDRQDVALEWTGSSDSTVVSYQILRADGDAAPRVIGKVDRASVTYVDRALPEGTYEYTVRGLNMAQSAGAPSNAATVSVNIAPPIAAIILPKDGDAVSGLLAVRGTAFAVSYFKEYRLFYAATSTPTLRTLLARASTSVQDGPLGTLDVTHLPEGGSFVLRLEAEDTAGNVGSREASFVVDNTPPAAPVLLSAVVRAADIEVTWHANGEQDLAGYLLFRNGVLANSNGRASFGDYWPYILAPNSMSYEDAPPDGDYSYQLIAVDRAGNFSALSNVVKAVRNNRAPQATITTPLQLAHLTGPSRVTIETIDQDVAQIELRMRADSAQAFAAVGQPLTAPPYEQMFDSSASNRPAIELQAVATDRSGLVDPNPASTVVLYDPPLLPLSVSAHVEGDAVTLSWVDRNAGERVAGYLLTRDGADLTGVAPRPTGQVFATSTAAGSSARGAYDGDPSTSWSAAGGLEPNWRIEFDGPILSRGIGLSSSTYPAVVLVRVGAVWARLASGSYSSYTEIPIDPPLQISGIQVQASNLSEVAAEPVAVLAGTSHTDSGLDEGSYVYEVSALGIFGQTQRASVSAKVYRPFISSHDGVVASAATVNGWAANPGDAVTISVNSGPVAEVVAAGDGSFTTVVPVPAGSNMISARATDGEGNKSLESWPIWIDGAPPPQAGIALSLDGVAQSSVSLSFAVSGDTSLIAGFEVMRRRDGGAQERAGVVAANDRAFVDPNVQNGEVYYAIRALNAYGFGGPRSNEVKASVSVVAPNSPHDLLVSPVPNASSLALHWTAESVSGFRVERALAPDGEFTTVGFAEPTYYLDVGLDGATTYWYRVRAIDQAGNASAPSNIASGRPDSSGLNAPVVLSPTVAGTPLSTTNQRVTISGTAPHASEVELFDNARAVARVPVARSVLYSPCYLRSQPSVSPPALARDGSLVAYVNVFDSSTLLVESLKDHSQTSLSIPNVSGIGNIEISPDGTRVAFEAVSALDFLTHVHAAEIATGVVLLDTSGSGGNETWPSWSWDSSRVTYIAARGGIDSIAVEDVSGGGGRQLIAGPGGLGLSGPRFLGTGNGIGVAALSPAGEQASGLWKVDVATSRWSEVYRGHAVTLPFAASPAQARMALAVANPGSMSEVHVVDDLLGSDRLVAAEGSSPLFSVDGTEILFGGSSLRVYQIGSGQTLDTGWAIEPRNWSGNGILMASYYSEGGYESTCNVLGDVFEAGDIPLFEGMNEIVGVAKATGGATSPASAPITIVRQVAPPPAPIEADLTVALVVQPSIPVASQPANAFVTVTNAGMVAADSPQVKLSIVSPNGDVRQLPLMSLFGSIPPGGSLTGIEALDLRGLTGPQRLVALVDPSALIPDGNDANNSATLSFTVATSEMMAVFVAPSPTAAEMSGSARVDVTILNPGPARDAMFRVSLQSKDGVELLAAGDDEVYLPFPAFASQTFGRTFSVGTQLAGDYEVVARGLSPNGDVLAVGKAPFTILPDWAVGLTLSASRASYRVGENIELVSSVKNLSANAILSGAELRFRLVDAANGVQHEEHAPIPILPLGVESKTLTSFGSSALSPSEYRVVVEVWLGTALLNSATAAFAIVNQTLLAGSLSISGHGSPAVVPSGAAVGVDFRLQNTGPMPVSNLLGHLTVFEADTLSSVSNLDVPVASLAPGAVFAASNSIATSALAKKTYLVSLSAEADGLARELVASGRFRVGDAVPPQIVSLNLSDGQFVQGALTAQAQVVDASPGVALAEVSVDGAAPVALTLQAGSVLQGTWSHALTLAPDGAHVLTFDAMDGDGNGPSAGNSTNPVKVTVISDTVPPVVTISGVDEGALTNADVTPIVTATDLNLAGVRTELNGAQFKQGTVITGDGEYVLVTTGTDKALNSTTATRRFTVDKTPPSIVVIGIGDGDVVASAAVLDVRVTDPHLSGQAVLVDGASYIAGTAVGEGTHTVDIGAGDRAGNQSELHLRFAVDATPPVIALTGFGEGEIANRQVAPGFVASDAEIAGTTATLNQRPFQVGSLVTAEGDYVFEVRGWDRALNLSTKTGHFTIDRTPPSIALSGVAEGEVRAGTFAPTFSVSDAHLASVEAHHVLGGGASIPFASGDVLTAEGDYTLTVNAVDAAGNRSTAALGFSIDRTAPDIQISGVVDGEIRAAAIMPLITVTDAHPGTVQASLTDGVSSSAFISGTSLAQERDYVLTVQVTDRAGNSTTRVVHFSIDLTPPAIALAGVADGEVSAASITPTFGITDAHPGTSSATLRTAGVAAAFTSGTTLTAEADYELEIHATDALGNSVSMLVKFAIDRTSPQVAISGFQPGGCVAADVSPTFSVTDAHPATFTVTLDGASFTVGKAISNEGKHQLSATATDLAGNSGSASASFTLDKTPPEIAITGVAEGVSYASAPVATVTATDANLTTSQTLLDGSLYQSGTPITAPGAHVLTAEAVDCAGNRATQAVRFSVNEVSFDFRAGLTSVGRVLVALECSDGKGRDDSERLGPTGAQQGSSVNPDCVHKPPKCTIPTELGSALQSAGLEYDLAGSQLDFLSRMRTNRYRAYVVWGNKMVPSLTPKELREHVWEGVGLLLTTDEPCQLPDLSDVLGVQILGALPKIDSADILAVAPPGPLALSGRGVVLKPRGSQVLAVGAGKCAKTGVVATLSTYGRGRALTVGFDPERAPSPRMTEVMSAWLHAVADGPPPERVPLSIETIDLEAKNLGSVAREVRITATPPQMALVLETAPEASVLSPPTWLLPLAPQEGRSFSLLLGLSDDVGANSVLAELATKNDGTYVPYTARTLHLPVARSGAELLAEAQAGLLSLALKGPEDAHRRKALRVVAPIQGSGSLNRDQVEDRIEALLVALREVAQITSVDTGEVRLTMESLLRYWELRWTRLGQ